MADSSPTKKASSTAANAEKMDKHILQYMRSRGMVKAEAAMRAELGLTSSGQLTPGADVASISLPLLAGASLPSSLPVKGKAGSWLEQLASLAAVTASTPLQTVHDPEAKVSGYSSLVVWVSGALAIYRPQLRLLLFPIFVHTYISLLPGKTHAAAAALLKIAYPHLAEPEYASTLSHLAALKLEALDKDPIVARWRSIKFSVKLGHAAYSLLMRWLSEPAGPGRMAILAVVNDRLKIDVSDAPQTEAPILGLVSDLLPPAFPPEVELRLPEIDYTLAMELYTKAKEAGLNYALPVPPADEDSAMTGHEDMSNNDTKLSQTLKKDQLLPYPTTWKTADVAASLQALKDERDRFPLIPTGNKSNLPSICAFTLHDTPDASCIAISDDEALLAVGSGDSTIRLWNLRGDKLKSFPPSFWDNPKEIKDFVSLNAARKPEEESSSVKRLIAHSAPVTSLAFSEGGMGSRAGKTLLSSSMDGTIRLWSMETFTNVVLYRGHVDPVWCVKFSAMGDYFASASKDRTARIWRTDRSAALRILVGHHSDVDHLSWHPNGLYLATASLDRTARLWDIQRGVCVRVFLGHTGPLTSLAISPDGQNLVTAEEEGRMLLYSLLTGKRIKELKGHTAAVYSVAWAKESGMIISGSADRTVRCWDANGAGGLKKSDGALPVSNKDNADESSDLLATFHTKKTPVSYVHVTRKNLVMIGGSAESADSNVH